MNLKPDSKNSVKIPGFVVLGILIESYPHILYRAERINDQKRVVLKSLLEKYPKKEHVAGIRREFLVLSKLKGDGVIEAYSMLSYGNGNLAIVLEEFGMSLDNYINTFENRILPLSSFFEISIQLVQILDKVHQHGIIHKDIVPRNILIDPETKELKIIDFSSSALLAREHQELTFQNRIAGSLPYISPEQTGRMNRDIDYRSDYYSLGVSFFELVTGELPFKASNALEWVYCHISKQAPRVHQINPKVPPVLSEIIKKLISKNAEDRYQSSHGICVDLSKAKEAYQRGDHDLRFPLAEADFSRIFQIPQKLYGRDKELLVMESFFEKSTQGSVELCLVSGYSGVGKSVLVHELERSIAKKEGFLIHGKFEQFRQKSSYYALASAFRMLVKQLLGETKDRLDEWRNKITQSLGPNAQLIVEIIPELELIIGKQTQVQALSPAETQNRFLILFINFVKVFAHKNQPLVIFLDDLQWSDIPTLHLISRLVTSEELGYLMIIGAYRDNVVDPTHPLSLTIEEIRRKRHFEDLSLSPLGKEEIANIVQDTLSCDDQKAKELGDLLFEKTGGNPFFTIEILKNLHEQKIIHFDSKSSTWSWNIQEIKKINQSDNVVDFLVSNQSRLRESTQKVLQYASCIGATFDLKTLSIIRESSMEKTAFDLYDALMANMIMPLSESYRLVGLDYELNSGFVPEVDETDVLHINPIYKFQHDRVQQAVYSMIPEGEKQALHLSIGRLMLSHTKPEELMEVLIDVVEHFNQGRNLITSKEEKRILAELNLEAGIKAKQSSAYQSALDYLLVCLGQLSQETWDKDFPFMWKLGGEVQSCFYLTGNLEKADEWSEILLDKANNSIEKGTVLSARTRQYATTGRMQESIQAAYQGFEILDFQFIMNPNEEDLANEISLVKENLRGREIADLIYEPDISDSKAKIASLLLMEVFPAAFLSGSGKMFPYLVMKGVNIALKYGNCPESAFNFAGYGMILCGYFENTATGYQYGKLGVDLIEKYEDISLKSRIIYVYTMFVHHWSNHWSTMTPWFRKGIDTGYQSGDLLYLAYSAQDCIIWDPKLDLETATKKHSKLLRIVEECEYQDSLDSGTLFLQMLLNFQGLTEGQYSMTDESFDEYACKEGMHKRHFMTGIANYHIYKAEIHLLYNDPQGALPHILEQEKLLGSVMSLPQMARFHIVSFLVRAMLFSDLKSDEKESFLDKMKISFGKISKWAEQCIENFEHLRLLMKAELTGIEGEVGKAIAYYEQAIHQARLSGFIRDEAMANEMMARFWVIRGMEKAAEGYLQAAHYLYYRWGALRKIDELCITYPAILGSGKYAGATSNKTEGSLDPSGSLTVDFNSNTLDISSVFRASQLISGELKLEKLLKATLQILIENAGAQIGYLLEIRENHFQIQASNENGIEGTVQSFTDSDKISFLPISLINTSIRTNQHIVLGNASEINQFSSDPYILDKKPLSVMVVPLSIHSQWKVAVYLENNLTHSAFTEGRVNIIKLLAAQAAISIDNARIYEKQEKLLKAQQQFVPIQFLSHLGHNDISKINLGESVAMEMSVLFSDIRDFTPLVELLSPEAVIDLLNQYFSNIGVHIEEEGGFVDSFAGDEILALFAVPAQQAVKAGVSMITSLHKFNRESESLGRPVLKMGIGINTGPLVLGTMGGENRMQCTVLGDTVNLGSRIENLTKVYGAEFLISEHTFRALSYPKAFSIRMVDKVAVKGKVKPVEIYEILDGLEEPRKLAKESTKNLLEAGMKAYFSKDFKKALNLFQEGKMLDPLDPVFGIFCYRSENYLLTPPPLDWKGYEMLQHK